MASTAHRLLALLAEGLGSAFQPYCKSVLGAMLLKLKDKKCVAVLGTCLDKVYGNPHSLDQVHHCHGTSCPFTAILAIREYTRRLKPPSGDVCFLTPVTLMLILMVPFQNLHTMYVLTGAGRGGSRAGAEEGHTRASSSVGMDLSLRG